MNTNPHTVRKLDHSEHVDFDEQLWPVNLALLILCGCVGGMIWAVSDFQSPDFLENGYVRMVGLVGSVLVLGGLAMHLGGRQGRRLQMAAFLSLALHGMGMGALALQKESRVPDIGPKNVAKHELRAIDVLPDYHLTRVLPNRPQEDHEKPVETKLPDLALQAIPSKPREQPANLGAVKPADEVAIADPTPKLVAPPLERKPIEPAAPRRGDVDAKLAKQQSPNVAAPAAGPVRSIDLSVPTTKVGPLEARSTPVGRQTTDPQAPRNRDDSALAMLSGLMQPGGPRSAAAPRNNDQPSPLVAVGPTLVKSNTQPGPMPRGDVPAAAAAAKAAAPDLSQLHPAAGVGRQASAGAIVGRTGTEIASAAPIAAPTVAFPSRVRMAKPDAEPLASGPNVPRILPRSVASAARPIADFGGPSGQMSARAADGGPGPGPLSPMATQVARGTPAAGAPARSAAAPLAGPAGAGGFGVSIAMAGPQPGRPQLAAGPNPDASLPLGGPVGKGKPGFAGIGKASTLTPAAGLPAAGPPGGIEGTPGKAAAADSPAEGPVRVGVAKGTGGKVGPGNGEGFDIGLPDAAPKVNVAAAIGSGGGASRRAGDGPGVAGGPAVGAGQPGGLARNSSSGASPAGATAVSPDPGDVLLGGGSGPATGSLEVASLAGSRRSEIGGPIGGGSGLGGSGTDDTAGAQPSLNVGIGSGTGGGPGGPAANEQPAIGLGTTGQQLPRSIGGNSGSGGTATVAGGDPAAAAALPGGNGNGGPGGSGGDGNGPGGPLADSRATGAVRTAPGAGIPGGAATAGGKGPGDGPGGDGGGGGNGQIGAAQIGRPGAGSEDLPGGIVGGVPGGLGSGIGRVGAASQGGLAGDAAADQPQLAAGSPTGGGNQGTGKGGNGPGGDGSGPNGPGGALEGGSGGIGRQATGGPPAGGGTAGEGDGTGQPAAGIDGLVGGAQFAGPASGDGSPGLSGNSDGGPSAAGNGLSGLLPKSSAIGTPAGMAAQGSAPQFAGSPATSGPGNNAAGAAGGPDGPGGPGGSSGPGGNGSGRRYGNAGLPVPAGAVGSTEGTAGVGVPQFGLPDRRALPDSDQLAISSGRFLQRQPGGGGPEVAADAPVRAPTPSFSGRARDTRGAPNGTGNGDRDSQGRTEQAIELGLVYLARMQAADGSWSLHNFPGATAADAGLYRSDTAATGLALLAFLGAGYDHFDDKYHNTVRRGLEYLLRNQKANGDLFLPTFQPKADKDHHVNSYASLYSHAIASLAVCEALGMTGDKRLREPAQKAVDFILASQDRKYGGWRYIPGQDTDTSVTGWQTTALKSGELAGLDVPKEAYENVSRWLDYAQASPQDASRYIYQPQRKEQLPQDSDRPTMTSVALLTRIYTGWKRDNPNLLRGAEFIKAHPPLLRDKYTRDTYYWYYATQVMFQLGGDNWTFWNERLHPLLINSQIAGGPTAGSWDPMGQVPDRWGDVGGRIYVTTMNLLSLEVYYRHLPIYEVPAAK